MEKTYTQPKFELVATDEGNRVFFTASGTPEAPTPGGSISSMSSTDGAWS